MKKIQLIMAALFLPLVVFADSGVYITGDMGYGAVLNAVNSGLTAGKMQGSVGCMFATGPVNSGIKISPAYYTALTTYYDYYNFILPVMAEAELPLAVDEKGGISAGFGIGPAYIKAVKNYSGILAVALKPAAYDGMGTQAELAIRYYKNMSKNFTFLAGITCEWLYADRIKAYDIGDGVETPGGSSKYNDRSVILNIAFKYGF